MKRLRSESTTEVRGRTYYMLLITFLSIVTITILGSVMIVISAYRSARDTSEEALDLAMRSYDLYLQNIKTSMSAEEMREYLNQDGMVESWADMTTLPEDEQQKKMMSYLSELHNINSDTDREYFLYFVKSDQWIGSWRSMREGLDEAEWLMHRLDMGNLPKQEDEETKQFMTTYFMEDRSHVVKMVEYHMIFPEVFLICYGGAPTLPLPEELSDLFAGSEMYFIDSHSFAYPFQENCSLMGKFTYEDMYTGSADNHIFSMEIDGKPYRCYTHATYPGNLAFVFLSLDLVQLEQERAVNIAILSGATLLVLAVLFCFWISNRIYRPVQQLMRLTDVCKSDRRRNEFQMLGTEFSIMKDQLSAQEDLLRRVRLLRMLRGQDEIVGDGAFLSELPTMNMPYFAVAALRIDDCVEKTGEFSEKNTASLEELLQTYMRDCGISMMTTQDSGFLLAVFGVEQKEITPLSNALSAFKSLMESKERLLISVYISEIHDSGQRLYHGYNEVLEVASYEDLIEEFNVVVTYDSVSAYMEVHEKGAMMRRTMQLNTAVTLLHTEKALRLYDEIVAEIMDSQSLSLVRMQLKLLKDQLMLAVYDAEKANRDSVNEPPLAVKFETVDASSTASIRETLAGILQELHNAESAEGVDNGMFREVLAFVQAHYRDPSFASSTVAAHFGTSQSNVTRMFNRFNHSGFLEYVHSLRIAKARELLETTEYSIADISTMVGYTNSLTMTRAFKRYTGTTPGSFRKK